MKERSSKTIKLLEIIGEVAGSISDLFEAIISSPYGSSIGRLRYEISRIERRRNTKEFEHQLKQVLHEYLHRLRSDGLVEKRRNKFTLTPKGKEEVKLFHADPLRPLYHKAYTRTHDETLKMVAFDIPEEYRRKRDWLRKVLSDIGFTRLQKSLWIGKAKLPQEFIEDLNTLNLLSYVEIFAVTKKGSVKHLS